MSLLCHYPIRAIIFPNQSTSEARNAPCYKLVVAWLLLCHMEIWTQLPQEALGPTALGLPVSTVSISHIWHSRPCYNYYLKHRCINKAPGQSLNICQNLLTRKLAAIARLSSKTTFACLTVATSYSGHPPMWPGCEANSCSFYQFKV